MGTSRRLRLAMPSIVRVSWFALVLLLVALGHGTAQAQFSEHDEDPTRDVVDEQPGGWEEGASATASVTLIAPPELRVCRRGRLSVHSGWREQHWSCWPSDVPTLRVPSGAARLALARPAIEALGDAELADGDTLRVTLEDRSAIRIAGYVTLGVGIGAGLALMIAGAAIVGSLHYPLLAAGAITSGVAIAAGAPMAALNDATTFDVTHAPAAVSAEEEAEASADPGQPVSDASEAGAVTGEEVDGPTDSAGPPPTPEAAGQ